MKVNSVNLLLNYKKQNIQNNNIKSNNSHIDYSEQFFQTNNYYQSFGMAQNSIKISSKGKKLALALAGLLTFTTPVAADFYGIAWWNEVDGKCILENRSKDGKKLLMEIVDLNENGGLDNNDCFTVAGEASLINKADLERLAKYYNYKDNIVGSHSANEGPLFEVTLDKDNKFTPIPNRKYRLGSLMDLFGIKSTPTSTANTQPSTIPNQSYIPPTTPYIAPKQKSAEDYQRELEQALKRQEMLNKMFDTVPTYGY